MICLDDSYKCFDDLLACVWKLLRPKFPKRDFRKPYSSGYIKVRFPRSPAQAGCMRQVLGPGALGRPRGIRWRGRWEGGSGWGIHVNPWLIRVNVWWKPLQCCEVIGLQLIKKKN